MRKIAPAIFSVVWKPEENQQLDIVSEYYDPYNQIDQLHHAWCRPLTSFLSRRSRNKKHHY